MQQIRLNLNHLATFFSFLHSLMADQSVAPKCMQSTTPRAPPQPRSRGFSFREHSFPQAPPLYPEARDCWAAPICTHLGGTVVQEKPCSRFTRHYWWRHGTGHPPYPNPCSPKPNQIHTTHTHTRPRARNTRKKTHKVKNGNFPFNRLDDRRKDQPTDPDTVAY